MSFYNFDIDGTSCCMINCHPGKSLNLWQVLIPISEEHPDYKAENPSCGNFAFTKRIYSEYIDTDKYYLRVKLLDNGIRVIIIGNNEPNDSKEIKTEAVKIVTKVKERLQLNVDLIKNEHLAILKRHFAQR